jgi:hypothetical protein
MLRITMSKCQDRPMYVLEGRLAGEWVGELMRVTRALHPGTRAVIDIEHMHYVDALGEKALHWLNRLGAVFVARNNYGVDLCDRLKLRRLPACDSGEENPKERDEELATSARSCSPRQGPTKKKSHS